MNVDLAIVARDLNLPPEKIQTTVELLDAGNTIPFITRFRKDQTGALNEKQILQIKQRVTQLRALGERKTFVLKSIESQGKLTDDLKTLIDKVASSRRLEDLYLPFKPKKQSRAATARQQGLEPLANEIFEGASDVDLAERATHFVRVDKGLSSVDEVIEGVGHLVAEKFSEDNQLRSALRKIMWTEGKVACELIPLPEEKPKEPEASGASGKPAEQPESSPTTATTEVSASENSVAEAALDQPTQETTDVNQATSAPAEDSPAAETASEATGSDVSSVEPVATVSESSPETASPETPSAESATSAETTASSTAPVSTGDASETTVAKLEKAPEETSASSETVPAKKKKRKKKKKVAPDPFKDYENFKQPVKQVPPHRILAVNRGERANRIKVKIEVPDDKLSATAKSSLVPEEHPSRDFLLKCTDDALNRLIVPSLEREVRRELTDAAEAHAVEVFANNLRNLLLQPPIRDRIVLAIDPGFKRGCSIAVIDECGNLLDSGHVFVVGNQTRQQEGRQKIVSWINNHNVNLIAIGNGAACRQTEEMVSGLLAGELAEKKLQYVMVNEAGASVYSTSEIGREELPDLAPSIRSALSIGRRLQDPLSELVKISPASIGVGMYQHDVKAKHLSDSLSDVVQFCVNQVGVDVNTASPSLLKYVSGLNALTARRLVEHRQEKGSFKNRTELKEVSGFGDATFVQAAGFLRIYGGDNPLDRTSIHPESYGVAESIVKDSDATLEQLFPKTIAATAEPEKEAVSSPEAAAPETAAPPTEAAAPSETTASAPPAEAPVAATVETQPEVAETKSSEVVAAAGEESNASESSASKADAPSTPPKEAVAEENPKPATVTPSVAATRPPTLSSASIAQRKTVVRKLGDLNHRELAAKHNLGQMLIRDIVLALKRPDWDPRDKISKPILRSGIIKVDDLKPEMRLEAQVVNVVDFGVFVDIGLGESSLIHVSQLSNQFIRDPHRLFAIGDVIQVWVTEVEPTKRRVKLTAVRPGSKRPSRHRGSKSRGDNKGRSDSGQSRNESTDGRRKYSGKGKSDGGRPRGKSSRFDKSSRSRTPYKPRKPKPVKPITDKMLKGDEPMRSFSDLAQFVNKKDDKPKSDGKDEKKET